MPSTKALKPSSETSLHLDEDYVNFVQNLKAQLKQAQLRASLAANVEQIRFYWNTGAAILKQQETKQWGSRFPRSSIS